MNNQSGKKWYQKPVAKVLFIIFFIPVGLFLIGRIIGVTGTMVDIIGNMWENNSSTISNSNNESNDCNGNGSDNCITEIRQRFQNTGKDIIGEQYEGDGIFQVQFIEYGSGTYNAYIRTDCDCEIAHLNVRPL